MSSFWLIKWISVISAISGLCTCLAILAQTLDDKYLSMSIMIFRILGVGLGMCQFAASVAVYFTLKTGKLWGVPFYAYTIMACCTTITYLAYFSRRYKHLEIQQRSFSLIDTCVVVDLGVFILFHLIVIFDCDGESNRETISAPLQQIYTIQPPHKK